MTAKKPSKKTAKRPVKKDTTHHHGTKRIASACIFLTVVSICGFSNIISREFPIYYLIISFITFLIYGFDKRAAINEDQRIPELILHGFSVLGGWPGALLGQQIFRHKTIKKPFLVFFWITVAINFILFYQLLITPEGTALFKMVI